MTDQQDQPNTPDPGDVNDNAALTREALYDLVWSEPMLKVAARFGVSSSHMARVCTLLYVPRPERGYWAKLAVGKAPLQTSRHDFPTGRLCLQAYSPYPRADWSRQWREAKNRDISWKGRHPGNG